MEQTITAQPEPTSRPVKYIARGRSVQYRGFTITRLTEDAGLRQYLVQPPIRNGQEAYRTLTAAYKAISATQRRAHLVVPRR